MMEAETEVVEDLYLICRLCIVEKGTFAILLSTQILIKDIFGVTIQPYDGLSQLLCSECREKVLEIQQTRTKYIENQDILVQLKESYLKKKEKSHSRELISDNPTISSEQNDARISESPTNLKRKCDDCESRRRKKAMLQKPRNGDEISVAPSMISTLVPTPLVQENDNIKTENEKDTSETRNKQTSDTVIKIEPDELDQVTCTRLADDVLELLQRREAYVDVENNDAMSDSDDWSNLSADELETSGAGFNGECETPTNIDASHGEEHLRKYFCRMCENNFDTTVSLKFHLTTHAELIKVLGLNTKSLSDKSARAENKQCPPTSDNYHPLYYVKYIKRKVIDSTEVNPTNSITTCDNINNSENLSVNEHLEAGKMKDVIESNTNVPKPFSEDKDTSFLLFPTQAPEYPSSELATQNDDTELSTKVTLAYIGEVVSSRINKYHKTQIATELKQVHEILQACSSKNMRLLWKDMKENMCPEIVLKPIPDRTKMSADGNLSGFRKFIKKKPKKKDNNVNSAQTSTTEMSTYPIIVNTTSITSASHAECIDLDNDTDKVTSDNFETPISPLAFLKFLLKTQNLTLSFERCQDNPIACFKRPVEPKRNLTVSIYCRDNVFTIEASEAGGSVLDLLKETFVTQWEILTSLKGPNIQCLMLNCSKRVNDCQASFVKNFITIVKSINGTIQGDSVRMDAPTTFFLSKE